MVNCNPETVSTDYDTSDRLYFEPLTAEDVLEIIDTERSQGTLHGVIVQFGGQTPLKLAAAAGSGKCADPRHLARRHRPRRRPRPLQGAARQAQGCASRRTASPPSPDEARAIADRDRLSGRDPAVLRAGRPRHGDRARRRPARPLPGAPGRAISTGRRISSVSDKRPLLIDRYLSDAIEVDVDCLADGKDTFIAGIMEHIEEAGIHSGDSRLRAAAAFAQRRDHRRARAPDPRAGAGAPCRRADERAIRHQGRRHLRAGSQSARLADGALRRQSDRPAGRQDRRARDGGRKA